MGSATDPNLTPVLTAATDDELTPIRDYILKALTNGLDIDDGYLACPDKPSRYVPQLVFQVRTFGGNSILNIFRPDGVPYAEVVRDVASRMDVEARDGELTAALEFRVLMKVLDDSKEKMSTNDLAQLQEIVDSASDKHVDIRGKGALAALAAQGAINLSGFAAYQLAVIVANGVARAVLGRGLALAANAGLARAIGVFAGPIGWALSALWLIVDVSGPAYRVTIPCVLHVGMLRLGQSARA